MEPLVSVVVPTLNSEVTLERCLRSVKEQTYKSVEIIVVDNHSVDRTEEIACSFDVRFFTVGPERSSQMNLGAKVAKGKYLYIIGSDFILQPTVVEEAVNACEQSGFDMIAVHNTSDPTVSFWSKVRKLERDCYRDDTLNIAARFFRLSIFLRSGGLDENLIASEDYDLHNRLIASGYKCGRISAEEVHIGEPRTLSEVISKHIYYGKVVDRFIAKNPKIWPKQLSPFKVSYIRHWKDFLRHPILSIGFIVYQTIRYAASIYGFLLSKLDVRS